MGYLTGLGELLVYEIFHLTKPQQILFMEGNENLDSSEQHYSLLNIRKNIETSAYI